MPLTRERATDRPAITRGIVGLIEQGHLQRADYLVCEDAKRFGSPELLVAIEASKGAAIRGWEEVAADMLQADAYLTERHGRSSAAVSLDLINRGDSDRLLVARCFHAAEGAAGEWPLSPDQARPVAVEGVEPLMAIQRRPLPPGTDARRFEGTVADTELAGLLILVRWHAVAARCLLDPGLPRALRAIVGVERVEWPMEQGICEYGPVARRTIEMAAVQRDAAAARAVAEERRRENQAHYDRITAQFVTEMREKRFLLAHWSRWTERDKRRKAIELFDASLKLSFSDLAEVDAPGWDASDAQFEAALRRFAESRNPGDIDAVLGEFDSDDRSQLHLMFMDFALRFGGREVQKHWLRTRGHAV